MSVSASYLYRQHHFLRFPQDRYWKPVINTESPHSVHLYSVIYTSVPVYFWKSSALYAPWFQWSLFLRSAHDINHHFLYHPLQDPSSKQADLYSQASLKNESMPQEKYHFLWQVPGQIPPPLFQDSAICIPQFFVLWM